jgi:hypothetical protein
LAEGVTVQRMKDELYSAGEVRARHGKMLERFATIPTYELHYSDLNDAIRQLEALA